MKILKNILLLLTFLLLPLSASALIPVQLNQGGTGSFLSDPGANRLWGWDDTDNAINFWTIGSDLSYDHSTHTLDVSSSFAPALTATQIAYGDGANLMTSTADFTYTFSNSQLNVGVPPYESWGVTPVHSIWLNDGILAFQGVNNDSGGNGKFLALGRGAIASDVATINSRLGSGSSYPTIGIGIDQNLQAIGNDFLLAIGADISSVGAGDFIIGNGSSTVGPGSNQNFIVSHASQVIDTLGSGSNNNALWGGYGQFIQNGRWNIIGGTGNAIGGPVSQYSDFDIVFGGFNIIAEGTSHSIVLGTYVDAGNVTKSNSLIIGGPSNFLGDGSIGDVYIGEGSTGAADSALISSVTFHTTNATSVSTPDLATPSMFFQTGIATGAGSPGYFTWVTSDIGASGTTPQSVSNKMVLSNTGELTLNKYGLGNITGTPTYTLAVDSSGKVIETTGGGGGTISGTGTDKHIMRWDGTTDAQDSGITISDNLDPGVTDLIEVDSIGALSFNSGQDMQFILPTQTTVDTAGYALTFQGSNGNGVADGGPVTLTSGDAGTTGTGGAFTWVAGRGGSTAGNGGSGFISGGDGIAGNGNGGNLTLTGGLKNGSGTNGKVRFGDNPGSSVFALWDVSAIASTDKTITVRNQSGTMALLSDITGGDVVGPASATDNAIARYDLTTGKLIQNSGISISDLATSTYTMTPTGSSAFQILGFAETGSNTGGQVSLRGGTGGSSDGAGGNVKIWGGSAGTTNANGGDIFIQPGLHQGSGTDGKIKLGSTTSSSVYALLDLSNIASTDKTILVPNSNSTLIQTSSNSSTLTLSGAFGLTLTMTGTSNLTLPTSGTLATLAGTETFTNKRITPRFVTTTQSATPTINTDNGDIFDITGLASNITSMSANMSGTPTAGQRMTIEITDNGTARSITWNTSPVLFAATTVPLPTTTVISTRLRVLFEWSTVTSKWECIGVV